MEETKLDIYVINLKHRTDRKNFILKQFLKYKNINLIFVEAVEYSPGSIGCSLSHQKCIRIGKEKGLKQIIVIEDDCLLKYDFYERLKHVYDYLYTKDDWYLFLGGINQTKPKNIIKKIETGKVRMFEVDFGSCFHMVIYNNTIYDKILDYDFINGEIEHTDVVWHEVYHLNALTCYPFLAYQKPGYSDLEKATTNYMRKLQITENRFKRYVSK